MHSDYTYDLDEALSVSLFHRSNIGDNNLKTLVYANIWHFYQKLERIYRLG